MSEHYISKLDSQRFGFKVAKIDSFNENPADLIKKLSEEGVKLILSKINLVNLHLINKLEDLGFKIKDSQVTYVFDLKRNEIDFKRITADNVHTRPFAPIDLDRLISILEESFDGYGHYFADERLDKNKCLDIYKDWGRRSCLDKTVADIVFVAVCKGEVAGLLSFKKLDSNGKLYAAGGLGAVAKKFRGINIFKNLIIAGLRWGQENNFEWEEHNVLTTNYAVNSSFSTLGFKIKNSFVTMHCWL